MLQASSKSKPVWLASNGWIVTWCYMAWLMALAFGRIQHKRQIPTLCRLRKYNSFGWLKAKISLPGLRHRAASWNARPCFGASQSENDRNAMQLLSCCSVQISSSPCWMLSRHPCQRLPLTMHRAWLNVKVGTPATCVWDAGDLNLIWMQSIMTLWAS